MTETNDDYVVIGKVGSTYGIKGWLKILSYSENVVNILNYNSWYIQEKTDWQEIEVQDGKEHGKGIIAKLAGFDTPEKAKILSGKPIAVKRSQMPKLAKNEYYWNDLKGLTVIDQQGQKLGQIIYLLATGSNDVLVVKGAKEHAIPYLPGQVVKSIDLDKGEMHVDWEVI